MLSSFHLFLFLPVVFFRHLPSLCHHLWQQPSSPYTNHHFVLRLYQLQRSKKKKYSLVYHVVFTMSPLPHLQLNSAHYLVCSTPLVFFLFMLQ